MRESTSPAAEGIHTNANDIEVASTWLVLVHAHCPYLLLPVIPYVARTSPSSTTSNPPPLPLTRLLLRSHVLLSVMLWSRRAGLFLAMPHLPPSLMPITHCVDRTSPSSIADTPPPHSRARLYNHVFCRPCCVQGAIELVLNPPTQAPSMILATGQA